ncbi:hypothetical protein [Methanolobus sp. ZRKC5]
MGSISVSIITIIFLIWRWHFFHALCTRSVDVIGYIYSANAFVSGGSRVEYKYEFQGVKYLRGNALTQKVFFNHEFHEGDEVVLRVDPKNPKRAVIKELYF